MNGIIKKGTKIFGFTCFEEKPVYIVGKTHDVFLIEVSNGWTSNRKNRKLAKKIFNVKLKKEAFYAIVDKEKIKLFRNETIDVE